MSGDLTALAVATVPCPLCGARPGVKCRTRTGRRATWQHTGRTQSVYDAWRIGYEEGLQFAADNPDVARRMLARRKR